MPFVYQIEPVTNLILIEALDHCNVPSFIEVMQAIIADEGFNSKTKILFDTSLAVVPTDEDVAGLIDAVTSMEIFQGRKVAVLAREMRLYFINKKISIRANLKGTNIQVFADLHKAIEWLADKETGPRSH